MALARRHGKSHEANRLLFEKRCACWHNAWLAGMRVCLPASTHQLLDARLSFPSHSYEAGANITDTGVLQEVGRQLGLPEAELQAALG